MKGIKTFMVLRYLLIENKQGTLVPKPLPTPKGATVVPTLLNGDRDFFRNGVRYSFVGFSFIKPSHESDFPESRFLVGKTAKFRLAQMGEKVPGDIISHDADDWIPIITIIDLVAQYIFVQHDWRFGTQEQIAYAIQTGLKEPILEEYNHLLFIEPKTTKGEFWKVVKNHKKIYKIELDLISPNILETNIKARDALQAMQELFQQDEVKITLTNEYGELKSPKSPIADYVDYIEEGEGKWSVTTEGSHGGKKTHKSSSAIVTIDLDVPSEDTLMNEQQLELETGKPTQERMNSDARMVTDVYSAIKTLLSR